MGATLASGCSKHAPGICCSRSVSGCCPRAIACSRSASNRVPETDIAAAEWQHQMAAADLDREFDSGIVAATAACLVESG